ncbi:glycoside hydrolase family 72 protein [Aaosphaeria arxii CBS 175.79]|uniref:1,3-beta-glucanosyltransferase n=1 Tax=Aaosphaeria arxii CBS 175.79 TaxID=1450172 RepID=A0A6A5Y4J8_9PLEO|nr:glycoside hydrolase family 72 protein [Aaosphaeria arxii CBS 175.79]KAF2020133.1 glycoside hydrolase family 72 protein [Aaosphaeria arxii CBS 175.79]
MRSALLTCAIAGLTAVHAIPTIKAKGSKFFTSEGNQFFVKGIAYQLVPDDPLLDAKQCKLDADLMKEIGTNSIRVYHVDPEGDHDECMKTFEDAGIYLWLDLDTFDTQIEQNSPHWNETQLQAFQKVMDGFHQYDNLAGFFVGNEVITKENGTLSAPFVKAAARDLKSYRDSKGYRKIPVGYSAADIAINRPMLQNFLACGSNSSESIDFFALNTYSWCGDSSYSTSGYNKRVEEAKDYPVPIFISETGCNTVPPRDFADQAAVFGKQMSEVYSGAMVYEWIQEANNYGIISYGPKVDPESPNAPPDGFPRSGKPTPVDPDFANLSKQWKTLNPTGIKESDYKPTATAPACPSYTSAAELQWLVNGNDLPTVGATYQASASATQSSATPTGGSNNGEGQPSATPKQGLSPGSPVREVQGMGLGLFGVLLGFFWWM